MDKKEGKDTKIKVVSLLIDSLVKNTPIDPVDPRNPLGAQLAEQRERQQVKETWEELLLDKDTRSLAASGMQILLSRLETLKDVEREQIEKEFKVTGVVGGVATGVPTLLGSGALKAALAIKGSLQNKKD